MKLWTARVDYDGRDRVDVTRQGGSIFGPSWALLSPVIAERRAGIVTTDERFAKYSRAYTREMLESYVRDPEPWREMLRRDEATLVCFCTDGQHCHRRVLASMFVATFGATYHGERQPRQARLPFGG